jgi:hypothetical protein
VKTNNRKTLYKLTFFSTISTVLVMSNLTGYGLAQSPLAEPRTSSPAASFFTSPSPSAVNSPNPVNETQTLDGKLKQLPTSIGKLKAVLNKLEQETDNKKKEELQKEIVAQAKEIQAEVENILEANKANSGIQNIQLSETGIKLIEILLKPLQRNEFSDGVKQIQLNLDVFVQTNAQDFGKYGKATNQKVEGFLSGREKEINAIIKAPRSVPIWLFPGLTGLFFLTTIVGLNAFLGKRKELSKVTKDLKNKKNEWDLKLNASALDLKNKTVEINSKESLIKELISRVKNLEKQLEKARSDLSTPATPTPTSALVVSLDNRIVTTYNQDPRQFSSHYKTTILLLVAGNRELVLTANPNGKYLVFEVDSIAYLVPNYNLEVDEFILRNVESLFECKGFFHDYKKMTLVAPARVISNGDNTWELQVKGKLKFS